MGYLLYFAMPYLTNSNTDISLIHSHIIVSNQNQLHGEDNTEIAGRYHNLLARELEII